MAALPGAKHHAVTRVNAELKRQGEKAHGRRGTPHGRAIGVLEALH